MWPFKKHSIFPEQMPGGDGISDPHDRDIYQTLGSTPDSAMSKAILADIGRDVADIKTAMNSLLALMERQQPGGGG